MRLGFVGNGNMGLPMAHRLLNKGYLLTVFDIRSEAVYPLIEHRVNVAESPADLASEVETVLVSLPTPATVRDVAVGTNGLVNGSSMRVYVDLSTTGPEIAEVVASHLWKKGIAALDAPVSGGPPGAEKGTLTVMVSGPLPVYEKIRHILEVVGENIFYVGQRSGSAQMMKLINNLLSATSLAASSEAFVLGVKAGLDPEIMLKVINKSSGRNSATLDKFPRSILPRTFNWGFKNDLIQTQ
jgi:3-hydroxyisobutyrate dehydrogenase-like beta-hydroxyacid dehydrogenase